jgi:hypothetical protein
VGLRHYASLGKGPEIILRWQEVSGGGATLNGDGRSYEEMLHRGEAPAG